MATGPSHVGAAFLIFLAYALGAAFLVFLRAGLDTRRRELRRARHRRAGHGTASPTCDPAKADEHSGADIGAIRIRHARAASQMKLLSVLKDLEAKLRLEQETLPRKEVQSRRMIGGPVCGHMETEGRASPAARHVVSLNSPSTLSPVGSLTSTSASAHCPVLAGRR
jgi:hypothetical protein